MHFLVKFFNFNKLMYRKFPVLVGFAPTHIKYFAKSFDVITIYVDTEYAHTINILSTNTGTRVSQFFVQQF